MAGLFGLIVLAAGLVKWFTDGPVEVSAVTSLVPDWLLALVPLYEIGLGLWLLSGGLRFGAWLAALATLGLFALHNLDLTSAGRSSCGCLGAAGPPPEVMLGLDAGFAALLLKRRPGWAGWPALTPEIRLAGLTAAVAVAGVGLAAGVAVAKYGSVTVALADYRGDPVALWPAAVDLGPADPEAVVERTVHLHNLTSEPVQVAMAAASCNCATFEGLPLDIAPGGRGTVAVRVRVSSKPGRFQQAGMFRSTAGDVRFEITGWVRQGVETAPARPE